MLGERIELREFGGRLTALDGRRGRSLLFPELRRARLAPNSTRGQERRRFLFLIIAADTDSSVPIIDVRGDAIAALPVSLREEGDGGCEMLAMMWLNVESGKEDGWLSDAQVRLFI